MWTPGNSYLEMEMNKNTVNMLTYFIMKCIHFNKKRYGLKDRHLLFGSAMVSLEKQHCGEHIEKGVIIPSTQERPRWRRPETHHCSSGPTKYIEYYRTKAK